MFKRKSIVVKLYTYDANHFEYFKLRKSTTEFPSWFKQLPTEFFTDGFIKTPVPTAKRCPALIEYFKKSVVIPNQFDLYLKANPDNTSGWVTPLQEQANMLKAFSPAQRGGYEIPHVKIDTSWAAVEETGVDFMITDAYYNNFDQPWRNAPGILDFKYQHAMNINISYKLQEEPVFIPVNSPLAFMFPMTDKEVSYEHHLVSYEEWHKIKYRTANNTFLSKYVKHRKWMNSDKYQ